MSIDLEGLKTFVVVVESGSFAKASSRLHKVQSAISYQVRKLEKSVGSALFDRTHYRAELTHVGRYVYQEACKLLRQVAQLSEASQQFRNGWEPNLSIVIDGIMPMAPIMRILKQLADQSVPTRIQVKVEFLAGVQYRFQQEHADIMLVKAYHHFPNFLNQQLKPIECLLTCYYQHPLAKMDVVSLFDLRQYVELSVNDSSEQNQLFSDPYTFGGDRIFHLSDFNAKKQALMQGLGFGWMPKYLIEEDLLSGLLKPVRYAKGEQYAFSPMLVYREDRSLGKAGRIFVESVLQALG